MKKNKKKPLEIQKQIKVFKSKLKIAKISFDLTKDNDDILARQYENSMKKASKQLEKRNLKSIK